MIYTMTKTNVHRLYTNIIFLALVLMPLLALVIGYAYSASSGVTFASFLAETNTTLSGILADNPLYGLIDGAIGATGLYTLIPASVSFVIDYMTYIANIYVLYMFVEILAFIPKMVGKWLSKMGVDDYA